MKLQLQKRAATVAMQLMQLAATVETKLQLHNRTSTVALQLQQIAAAFAMKLQLQKLQLFDCNCSN